MTRRRLALFLVGLALVAVAVAVALSVRGPAVSRTAVGPPGGDVQAASGLRLTFPTGALDSEGELVTMSSSDIDDSLGRMTEALADATEIRLDGTSLSGVVAMRWELPAGVDESLAFVARWEQSEADWEIVPAGVTDGVLTATVTSFSTYQPRVWLPDQVSVEMERRFEAALAAAVERGPIDEIAACARTENFEAEVGPQEVPPVFVCLEEVGGDVELIISNLLHTGLFVAIPAGASVVEVSEPGLWENVSDSFESLIAPVDEQLLPAGGHIRVRIDRPQDEQTVQMSTRIDQTALLFETGFAALSPRWLRTTVDAGDCVLTVVRDEPTAPLLCLSVPVGHLPPPVLRAISEGMAAGANNWPQRFGELVGAALGGHDRTTIVVRETAGSIDERRAAQLRPNFSVSANVAGRWEYTLLLDEITFPEVDPCGAGLAEEGRSYIVVPYEMTNITPDGQQAPPFPIALKLIDVPLYESSPTIVGGQRDGEYQLETNVTRSRFDSCPVARGDFDESTGLIVSGGTVRGGFTWRGNFPFRAPIDVTADPTRYALRLDDGPGYEPDDPLAGPWNLVGDPVSIDD